MNIHDIIQEDPKIGDTLALELGDLLIESTIDDVTDDGIVLLLDAKAIQLINNKLKENIQVDARLKSKIQRVLAQNDFDSMPYKDAIKKLSLLVFGRGKDTSTEHVELLKKYYPDPNERRIFEAEYRGRKVSLGKPFLTPDGPKKRSVYVKNAKGNVVKVNFGDKKLRIKKSNPKRRKSFRARHNCANPGPRWKARYWSCRFW
jgi:hypothetical protein